MCASTNDNYVACEGNVACMIHASERDHIHCSTGTLDVEFGTNNM
jgi:hypothetical protein